MTHQPRRALEIVPAIKEGYLVQEGQGSNMGRFPVPLFAGSLAQCLSFVRDEFDADEKLAAQAG